MDTSSPGTFNAASADASSRYATASGTATGSSTGAAATDAIPNSILGITVFLVRPSSAQQAGFVSVSVPADMVSSGKAFSFPLPDEMTQAAGDGVLRITLMDGKRLPAWLRYVAAGKAFTVAAMPPDSLPLEVLVRLGKRHWTLVISERARH
jgi:hypothetical protein